ncbi:MAG: hypothetical protein ABSA78_20710 [Candidatus Sulfotelmatobacter sp.]|jgi:hypothetical protein
MNPNQTDSERNHPAELKGYRSLAVVAAILAIASGGCGSSSSMTSNNTLSAAQAQAVSAQVADTLALALSGAFGGILPDGARPSLSTAVAAVRPDSSSGCTPAGSGESCNFPLSYTGPCSGGGTIAISGDIDGTLNNFGDGSIATQIVVTPANCSVSGTTINGDPDITLNGQINFTSGGPTYPITFMESGGISYGPNPAGSCKVDVTYSITNAPVSSCTVSGTVCGQPVSGNC